MDESWSQRRRAELVQLRSTDPLKLVAMYRYVMGLSVCGELPPGVSFTTMIDALLEHEALKRQADRPRDVKTA